VPRGETSTWIGDLSVVDPENRCSPKGFAAFTLAWIRGKVPGSSVLLSLFQPQSAVWRRMPVPRSSVPPSGGTSESSSEGGPWACEPGMAET